MPHYEALGTYPLPLVITLSGWEESLPAGATGGGGRGMERGLRGMEGVWRGREGGWRGMEGGLRGMEGGLRGMEGRWRGMEEGVIVQVDNQSQASL